MTTTPETPVTLRQAAQHVIDNWERGDLAGAVRELAEALVPEPEPVTADSVAPAYLATAIRGLEQAGYVVYWANDGPPAPVCQHSTSDPHMVCSLCGECSESLDENDVCADCIRPVKS